MAEVGGMLASPVLKMVFKQIEATIRGQITLQKDFAKDLKNMNMTLESLAVVLEDAERQSIERRAVQLWLKRLRNAMYDISDMLQEFEGGTRPVARKISLQKLASIGPNNKLANRMKKMREELKEITDQREKFRLEVGSSSTTNEQRFPDTRETWSVMKDEDLIVGRTSEKRDIMASLSKSMTGRVTIFPIYGIGGIGKTTLAKMVYNDAMFKEYSQVWVHVSQTFDLNKIGNSIISQLSKKEIQLTEKQMIHTCLVELLAGKNVMIVLDDLWEDNGSLLDDLHDMLKIGDDNKIVVIVTTRNEGIADKLHTIKPYKLAPLSNDSCWTIIKQKSDFDSREDQQHLEQIGKDIAMKCGGVALAARSLGHMLKDLSSDEWESVRNSNMWNVPSSKNTDDEVLSSLRLSYSYMPSHLKLCFAYCAIFQKGHMIVKDELIYQWNSLGFIEETNMFSTRQLGEKYVSQLLGLSFLEPSRSQDSGNGVGHEDFMHLTMHDLVHDLARLVLADELFLGVTKHGSTEGSSCRYALLDDCTKRLESYTDSLAKIRALIFLNCSEIGLHDDAFSSAKYLRVLDLSECFVQRIPDSIGQLKQLRYLNAPAIQHNTIPSCITKLLKLKYLNLRGSSALLELPDSIGEMECLMYLDLSGCSGLEILAESVGKLKKLVHLNLSNCLHVTGVSESLQSLTDLEYLNLSFCPKFGVLPEHLGSLLKLKYLNLSGSRKISELPRSFWNLKKLTHLDLSYCGQVKGIPDALGNLIMLQYLNLPHCPCTGGLGKIVESMGNLKKLRHLYLSGFLSQLTSADKPKLPTFLQSIGTLSNLEHLDLSHNAGLRRVPYCFGTLTKLRTLDLSSCRDLWWLPPNIAKIDSLKMLDLNGCKPMVIRSVFRWGGMTQITITLPEFEVYADDDASSSNLVLLRGVNPTELRIRGLEKVKSVEEVQSIKLVGKKRIRKLEFEWRSRHHHRVVEDNNVLAGLVPPCTVKSLTIKGYNSVLFPEWLVGVRAYNFPNVVKISLTDLANCTSLPPLGQLPNLKTLVLEQMQSVTKIEEDFCGHDTVPFRRLEKLTLDSMQSLEVCTTMYTHGGDLAPRYMFPKLVELNILKCPKLKLKPCPPKAEEWIVERSDCVISSWRESTSHPSTRYNCPVSTLVIRQCKAPMHQWRLLHHLPGLQNLHIRDCTDLTSSPKINGLLSSVQCMSLYGGKQEQLPEWLGHLTSVEKLTTDGFQVDTLQEVAKHLTSLQSLRLSYCNSMTALPQWVGDLTALQRLKISGCTNLNNLQEIMGCRASLRKLDVRFCRNIKCLPDSMQQLTKLQKLQILSCPELEWWCGSEENPRKLAHIKEMIIGTWA